jgi:hypothetical protein
MDRHDQQVNSTRRPLLLNFVRVQPAPHLNYRYDERQRLNVTGLDGVPVVTADGGRAMPKTSRLEGED